MTVDLRRKGRALSLIVGKPTRDDDPNRYISALEEIAREDDPFVLLVEFQASLALGHEHRRAQNLWFKTTRARMNALCRATAIVRKDPSEEMRRTFQGLWNFPVLVTDSIDGAEIFLAAHLPAETAP